MNSTSWLRDSVHATSGPPDLGATASNFPVKKSVGMSLLTG